MSNRPGLEQGSDEWFAENMHNTPVELHEAVKSICRGYFLLNCDDPDRVGLYIVESLLNHRRKS